MTLIQSPVKVGFIIDSIKPGAGTENQLILLLKMMDRRRVAPFLFCLRSPDTMLLPGLACPVVDLGVDRLASLRGARQLLVFVRCARKSALDLVITFFRDGNALGTVGSWLAGVPVISSRRNLGRGYWHTREELALLRALNRMTSWHVANSCAIRDYTINVEGVNPRRFTVLPNAVDLDRFHPLTPLESRDEIRARLGLPSGILICCVANLRPVKGVDILLGAFMQSELLVRECHLLLIGGGPEDQILRRSAARSEICDRVHFLGSRLDVQDIIRACDLAVLPSRAESLSNAILEYMASALPIVATDVGGSCELLHGGECGHLVTPESERDLRLAMETLVSDVDRRVALGRAARFRAETEYAADIVVEKWMRFFEERAGRVRV